MTMYRLMPEDKACLKAMMGQRRAATSEPVMALALAILAVETDTF